MTQPLEPSLTVSDTAFWVARFRAEESARPDAHFQDPYAAELAGPDRRAPPGVSSWPLIARTKLIDDIVLRAPGEGVDCVINLAAGLDTRPYRLPLPATLRWVEADLPHVIDYKERVLAAAQPRCMLVRERVDLADPSARRALLERAPQGCKRVLVISEGLLVYLDASVVEALARDLSARPEVAFWVFELVSPGVLRRVQQATDPHLAKESRMRFAPTSGVGFFRPFGFEPVETSSLQRTASRMGRAPWFVRLMALLPAPKPDKLGQRPWGLVVRLKRSGA